MEKLFERLPPQSLEAEMALLGSMILDYRVIGDVLGIVPSSDYFSREAHAAIFDALVKVYDQRHSGDLVQIVEAISDKNVLQAAGGPEYLVQLANSVPSSVNAPHYARIVREKAELRRLIDAASQILYDAYHAGDAGVQGSIEGAREVLDRAEQRIFDIAERSTVLDTQALAELLQQAMDMLAANEGRAITGLATGFYELDELMSGLQKGEMIIVAGRPSMGKTAFALNIAQQVACGGSLFSGAGAEAVPVAIFSMEMSRQAVAQRLMCTYSGVDSHRMRTNRLTREEVRQLMEACNVLSQTPIYIDDTPGLSVLMLRAKARRMVKQYGVRCIIVDYLQLMSAPSAAENRQQEVSAISRGIKALARELNIPVVCLAQLNRGAEQREGHRPRMADLRESGSLEQDADVILLLHREEYYHQGDERWLNDPDNADKIGTAEVIIAKQRNGPTDTVTLTWDQKTTRFFNLASSRRTGSDLPVQSRGGFAGEARSGPVRSTPTRQRPVGDIPEARSGTAATPPGGGDWDGGREDGDPPF